MTAINLDDQIVSTSYDKVARICAYIYQHTDGSRYTVTVPIDELHKMPKMDQRRNFLANKIVNHIQSNPPDKSDGGPAT